MKRRSGRVWWKLQFPGMGTNVCRQFSDDLISVVSWQKRKAAARVSGGLYKVWIRSYIHLRLTTVYGKWKFRRRSRPDTGYHYAQPEAGVWDLDWVFVVSTFTPGQSWATQLFSLQKVSLSCLTLTWIHPKSTKTKVMFICKTISFPFLYLFQIQINSRHLSGSSVRSVERTSCKSKSALAQQTAPDSVQKWKGHRHLLTWRQISRLSRLTWGSEISRWKERKVPTLKSVCN